MSPRGLMIFYTCWKSHRTSSADAIFSYIYSHIMAQRGLQKEHLIPPNQYISFKAQTRGWIINHCICCWVPPLPKTCLFSSMDQTTFVYLQFHQLLCLYASHSLKILWFYCQRQNRSQRDLIHWAAIQKTAWNSVELWTVFTVAICKLLRTKNWGSLV